MKTDFGICYQAYIPMRSEPNERAEQVSQVLFGEHFSILDQTSGFSQIELKFDGYKGWIDSKSIFYLSEKAFQNLADLNISVTKNAFTVLNSLSGDPSITLSAGSSLYIHQGRIDTKTSVYEAPKELMAPYNHGVRDTIVQSAMNLLNVPYLWGGRGSFGTDCSGLVQNVYKQAGIPIPRDASVQSGSGKTLSFINEALPGDLAFFDNLNGDIVHVGIILPEHRIIHASGKVRIDKFDHQGIYNSQRSEYSHKLRLIKQLIDAEM